MMAEDEEKLQRARDHGYDMWVEYHP